MNTTNENILLAEEKKSMTCEIATIADCLNGIERVSGIVEDRDLQLLVAGLEIYAERLYLISQRLTEVSEFKEVA